MGFSGRKTIEIKRSKILIVDDEPDVVRLISKVLRPENYIIQSACSGDQALEVFRKMPCDLVIADLQMPGMNGQNLLQQIKNLDKDVEFIILTGFGSLENAVHTLRDNGAFDYFTKPLDSFDKLISTIKQALSKRRLNLENKKLIKDIMKKKTMARTAIDSISDTIFMLNAEGTVLGVNKAALVYFGLKNFTDCIQKPCDKVLGISKLFCKNCQIKKYINTDETIEFERTVFKAPDRFENITIYPLESKGQRVGILVKIKDITQKTKITKQMERTDSLASIGILSAGISHEIRNPLHAIGLFTDILVNTPNVNRSENEMEILGEIKNGIQRIDKIINQTLSLARPKDIVMEPLKINDLILEGLKLWRSKFNQSNIRLDIFLEKNLPPMNGDKMSLEQVFNNLFSNAVESIARKGTISIRSYSEPSSFHTDRTSLYIEIKDTGSGITEENLEKIFNPFFSGKSTGTGLGLSITYRIVKTHGGNILVKSKFGVGTSFMVELPAMPDQNNDSALLKNKDRRISIENFIG